MRTGTTLIGRFWVFELWHKDPSGSNDKCGWFKRAKHGDEDVLERIEGRFRFEWDNTHISDVDGKVYDRGYFHPNGEPRMTPGAITLNFFWLAAYEHFNQNRNKAWKFVKKHLAEILHFAENPTDSNLDNLKGTFGFPNKEVRIRNQAAIIYGYVLRLDQKWWQHPRWYFWHWKLQFNR